MSPINNFEQLLIIKQIFEDSYALSNKQDNLSLVKAIILCDLSIELTLKNIIVHLNPSYFNAQASRRDLNFKDAWNEAESALQANYSKGLIEQTELFTQHDQRNLTQHRGITPSRQDIQRLNAAAKRMLITSFNDAFGLDFGNLRSWDFVNNLNFRLLLTESEDFLLKDDPIACIVGCYKARSLLTEVIVKHTSSNNSFSSMRHSPYPKGVLEIREFMNKKFSAIEVELILVGIGMPILDTRKFNQKGPNISIDEALDGNLDLVCDTSNFTLEEIKFHAQFMLNYLYRLLTLLQEMYPDLIDKIKVEFQLSQQITSNQTKL